MGGTVAVGFRFPDGSTIAQHRWTNPLPYFVHDVRLIRGDRDYLQTYLNEAEQPNAPMAPEGYGLVLIDYVSHHILTMQGYCSFGFRETASLMIGNAPETMGAFTALLRENRISECTSCNGHDSIPLPEWVTDYPSLREHACGIWNNKTRLSRFRIDMSPFKVIEFDETHKGVLQFLSKLAEINFPITGRDLQGWMNFLRDMAEE